MTERAGMSSRTRVLLAVAATVVLAVVAAGYVRVAAGRSGGAPQGAGGVRLHAAGAVLVRSTADGPSYGHLTQVGADGQRTVGGDLCARVYAANGSGVCLRPSQDDVGGYEIAVLDAAGTSRRAIPMNGIPSRARVSPSGRMISWTTFVSGDSYNGGGGSFSTRSGILDTGKNDLAGTLETFAVTVDGKPYRAQDVNFWGVTFTRDDNRFYATMSTAGKRYLVQGDFAARTFRTLRENVECPSLSPDGTRLAFKKRVSDDSAHLWRFAVVDLATMHETLLAETRGVDDQAAWSDDHTVMYGVPRDPRHADVWTVPADGTGAPKLLVTDAESPARLN